MQNDISSNDILRADWGATYRIENLNAVVLSKYSEEKEKFKSAGKSETECEILAAVASYKLPLFSALKAWQDVEDGIELKKAIKEMMSDVKIPTLIISSVSLKAISALKDPRGTWCWRALQTLARPWWPCRWPTTSSNCSLIVKTKARA